jgi:hypothetical protein
VRSDEALGTSYECDLLLHSCCHNVKKNILGRHPLIETFALGARRATYPTHDLAKGSYSDLRGSPEFPNTGGEATTRGGAKYDVPKNAQSARRPRGVRALDLRRILPPAHTQ